LKIQTSFTENMKNNVFQYSNPLPAMLSTFMYLQCLGDVYKLKDKETLQGACVCDLLSGPQQLETVI
jgi:hypothetical protein